MDFFDSECYSYVKCIDKFLKMKFENYDRLDKILSDWNKYKVLFEYELSKYDSQDNLVLMNVFNNFANLSAYEKCQLILIYNSEDNMEGKFLKNVFEKFKLGLVSYNMQHK